MSQLMRDPIEREESSMSQLMEDPIEIENETGEHVEVVLDAGDPQGDPPEALMRSFQVVMAPATRYYLMVRGRRLVPVSAVVESPPTPSARYRVVRSGKGVKIEREP